MMVVMIWVSAGLVVVLLMIVVVGDRLRGELSGLVVLVVRVER